MSLDWSHGDGVGLDWADWDWESLAWPSWNGVGLSGGSWVRLDGVDGSTGWAGTIVSTGF